MSNKSPFDMNEMMKMFDPKQIAKMFDPQHMGAALDPKQLKGFDLDSVLKHNQRNYDAMVSANEAAASVYKSFYENQMAVYQEVMGEASLHVDALQAKSVPDLQKKQAEIYEAAVAKSLTIMTELANATKRANDEATAVIKDRISEAVAEIQKK